jgi:FAD/FMN-containing dehydrogenase
MTDATTRTSDLSRQLPGLVSTPGTDRYAATTAIWAKQVGIAPTAIVHCRGPRDVQAAVRAARERDLPLSVRGGGHDWAGRALCDGVVIDLSAMRDTVVAPDRKSAVIGGGARLSDVTAVTDPLHLAVAAGSVASVGLTGLALGGGYGPLIGRCGLALDNVLEAQIVLADGSLVSANAEHDEELFWALRGGGGNFGVVTSMRHRLHELSSVHSGLLIYPFSEATTVLACCATIADSMPDEFSVQVGMAAGPDGTLAVMVIPTWCGPPEEGETRLAPFLKLGTLLSGRVERKSYGALLATFDPMLVNDLRVFIDTCWIPALDAGSIDTFVTTMKDAVSPGCAIVTHDFRGAATRVAEGDTAFGLRREHILIEVLAMFPDQFNAADDLRHRDWTRRTRKAFAGAMQGGYPNLLGRDDPDRAMMSYGRNAERLIKAKHRYDPDNVFSSAIPLPHR